MGRHGRHDVDPRDRPDVIDVPDLVRQRAESAGSAGAAWLDALPGVVAEAAARFELTIGSALQGGTAGFVAEATDPAGTPLVLKIGLAVDRDDAATFVRSVAVHRFANGRGCAALVGADLDTHPTAPAMVLERLGPNLDQLGLSVDEVLSTIATTLLDFWQPVTAQPWLLDGRAKAEWLSAFITKMWNELDHPCHRAVIDRAVELCGRRAALFDPGAAVLVHGDAHGWNTLLATPDTGDEPASRPNELARRHKFVDPEGLASEPAHDLAVPMREYNEPLLAGDTPTLVRARAVALGEACRVDPDAIWEWGFIERVSTGLANVADFDGVEGRAYLEVAERCL